MLGYERDRVRFLLKAYLRARLEKVQRLAGALHPSTPAVLCRSDCSRTGQSEGRIACRAANLSVAAVAVGDRLL